MSVEFASGLERFGADLLWRPALGLSTAWPYGSKWYTVADYLRRMGLCSAAGPKPDYCACA